MSPRVISPMYLRSESSRPATRTRASTSRRRPSGSTFCARAVIPIPISSNRSSRISSPGAFRAGSARPCWKGHRGRGYRIDARRARARRARNRTRPTDLRPSHLPPPAEARRRKVGGSRADMYLAHSNRTPEKVCWRLTMGFVKSTPMSDKLFCSTSMPRPWSPSFAT